MAAQGEVTGESKAADQELRGRITNKVLLYSTENYIQYPMINHNGKEYENKECVYIYITDFAVQQKLTQHCKSTILQQKNIKTEKKEKRTKDGGR